MTSSLSQSSVGGGRLFCVPAPPKTTTSRKPLSSSFASSCRRGGAIPQRMRDSLGASTSRGELVKTRRSARENEHHHRRNGKDGEKKTTTTKKKMKKKKNVTRNRAWNATKETVGEDECRDEEDVEANRARLTSGLLLDDAVPMEEHEKAQGEKTTVKDDPIVQEKRIDRGLGQRRALSAETRSRPFVPLGGEVLHLAWMREYDETGKFTKEEGEAYRETIKSLLSHYTTPAWKVTSVLDGVARGWSDVVLDLGAGFNCRLQRHSEFETLTLSGPGRLDDEISAPIKPWSWLLPSDWLADVPGRVFLIQHFIVRLDKETFADTVDRKTLNGEWLTLNGMKDARRGMHDPSEIIADTGVISNDLALRQEEAARQALASRVMSRDSSYFEDPLTTTSSTKGASKETFRDSELDWEVGAFAAANLGDGAKIYVNYQLDEDGGTQCLVTVPPGKEAFDRAMRQIQRLTIIEQYRLLILFRLPQAKAKRQSLAQLQIQYDNVSSILRKSRASNTDYRNQQEMLTQVADLESAVADVVAKTRMLALSAQAYQQIIELKFTEAQLKRVSYSARFLPLFVKKRLDPALSTIFFASEQAEILSAALSRTTNLIQAAVEVKLQRLNESIALYGLIFTVASVGLGLLQAWRIGNVGWLVEFTKTWFLKTMAWILSNFGHLFEHFHIYGLA
mmetsp:Transcript_5948/g.17519  ORF Transcript_5948/g.17519 Transcript_5948/m.17519 type:complete len:679 (+) Transcript_5948:146-2182(+)